MPENESFRSRSYSSKSYFYGTGALEVPFQPLARCDRSENDLESFMGGMPVANTWVDKRALSHR